MASNAGWNKTIPSGTSSVAQGDDEIRSMKSSLQAWWEEEHYATDGSANSAGEHKLGSARAYVGAASALSAPETGRIFWLTDEHDIAVAPSASSWSKLGAVRAGSVNTFTASQVANLVSASSGAWGVQVTGDSANRGGINADGKIQWGSGSGAFDTNLYREAANHLKTDDTFEASGLSTSMLTVDTFNVETLRVGSGASITAILSTLTLHDFGSIAADAFSSFTVGVTGASALNGDYVQVNNPLLADSGGMRTGAYISAADVVTVSVQNLSGAPVNPSARTFRVIVHQFA